MTPSTVLRLIAERRGQIAALDDAIGELGAALAQTIATDDKIIVEHMEKAHRKLSELRKDMANG